jgi:hypothetical protein
MLPALAVRAADTRPVVGPGATKEDVINAYGWPTGQGRLGTKEVLNYPQGSITLSDGKVERVDFSPNIPWAAPRPRPGAPSPTSVKRSEAAFDFWTTSFADAAREAQGRRARILAVFTGSDWSPPSRRFLEEVATSTDFYNAFAADFVFLKLDFPTRALQTADLKKQNEELRAKAGVTTYPALIVFSAAGEPLGVADLAKERPGSFREQATAAVAEVRDLLKLKLPPVAAPKAEPPAAVAAAPTAAKAGPTQPREPERGALAAMISSANWALVMGLGGGSALAALLVWWVWRTRVQPGSKGPKPGYAGHKVRLGDVPTQAELESWPVERLRSLVAAQFEATGYHSRVGGRGSEVDLELMRPGHTKPNVLVLCRPGSAGVVGPKAVRDIFGTVVSTGVEAGWIVSAAGFSAEARTLAHERGVELIDGAGLIERLRMLDPLALAQVLERVDA